jgi:hypothetical protein
MNCQKVSCSDWMTALYKGWCLDHTVRGEALATLTGIVKTVCFQTELKRS